ncbi:MAG: cobyrinate a,c-diamide synthase [Desulfonatronovibrio sp. MSAO_Bac4]|nr:MAG: cobyrinate a,c-diamide synthase [Desulfonatronovibrio sp. MSAO_Bac4]
MPLVIGGVASGSGKTSISLAIAAGLRKKGCEISCFKAGPDYLDPMYLELASGRPCYNLDPWMSSPEHVLDLVSRTRGYSLLEGVMGFYDGPDVSSSQGSTAYLASILESPVFLTAGSKAMARSFAALVQGFVDFEGYGQNIKGIIANGCGSTRHSDILSKALESARLPPLVGAFPQGAFPELSSRHLGLKVPDQSILSSKTIESFAEAAEKYLDLEQVLGILQKSQPNNPGQTEKSRVDTKVKIGVARDRAFNFYYQANLDILEGCGCEIIPFSPVKDKKIPQGVQMLYFGGGYPELYAYELSQNRSMLRDISDFITSRKPVYAECGGLVYLCRDLKILNGQVFSMVGALPFRSTMLARRKSLGYAQLNLMQDCVLGKSGEYLRGHEFHYSEISPMNETCDWQSVYQVKDARGNPRETLGIMKGSVLASYVHVYFGHRPETGQWLVDWVLNSN